MFDFVKGDAALRKTLSRREPKKPCREGVSQHGCRLSKNAKVIQEVLTILHGKSLRQSFPAPRRENKLKSVFSGDMRIGKNTSQPASVALGRPLTQGCMQRAASPRKNACIFEKRVELFRHARAPFTQGSPWPRQPLPPWAMEYHPRNWGAVPPSGLYGIPGNVIYYDGLYM